LGSIRSIYLLLPVRFLASIAKRRRHLTETAALPIRPATSEHTEMNTNRAASVLSAALLATTMALPALAQNNPPSADSAHSASAADTANSDSKGGSAAAVTHPKHRHAAQAKTKKKKQSFSKRMHDKAEKIFSAIKQ
jgi:hypothetical protein